VANMLYSTCTLEDEVGYLEHHLVWILASWLSARLSLPRRFATSIKNVSPF
jgi:hypothetical protein